jgi:hypothetical protein
LAGELAWLEGYASLSIVPNTKDRADALKLARDSPDKLKAVELEILAQLDPATAILSASESKELFRDEFGINMAACIRGLWEIISPEFEELVATSRYQGLSNPISLARAWSR